MKKVAEKFGNNKKKSYLRAAFRQTFRDYEERVFGDYERVGGENSIESDDSVDATFQNS